MCFLRHLSEDECLAALAEAEPFIGRIHGFGLDSSERGHPPSKFARLFARCRALGKPVVAHAGEEGRRPTSPRRSTSSARGASTTACGRRKTRRCSPAWPARACRSPSARSQHAAVRVCHDGRAQPAAADRRRRQGDAQQRRPGLLRRLSQRQHPRGAGRLRLRRRHLVPAGPQQLRGELCDDAEKAGWIARLDAYFAAAGCRRASASPSSRTAAARARR
jgi:adenosine deaminase